MLWHFTVERFRLTEKNLECWSAVEWVVLTSWWCVGWTAHIVDVVVFTRFIEDTRTPTTSPALTLHRQPTSTPGHVMLTLLLRVTTRDLFTRSRRHHTMTSTTHARSVDCILLLGCLSDSLHLSVGHNHKLCQKGQTNQDAIWYSGWTKEPRIRWGPGSPSEEVAILEGHLPINCEV